MVRRKRAKARSESSSNSPSEPKSKKQNAPEADMAESDVFSESPEELNSQECPSLQQMWTTLKRIEDNTSKLLEENKNLRAGLEFSQTEIKELKESNKKLMTRIQALEKQESLTNKKLQDLEEKCDDIEQYSRKFNLEIHGITEEENEDVGQIIFQVATKIDADVREEDIDICHRLNKKEGKPRPIIVKFNNYDAKYELYSKHLRLRKIDFMDSGRKGSLLTRT